PVRAQQRGPPELLSQRLPLHLADGGGPASSHGRVGAGADRQPHLESPGSAGPQRRQRPGPAPTQRGLDPGHVRRDRPTVPAPATAASTMARAVSPAGTLAATPATAVPWPSRSGALPSRHVPPTQLAMASTLPARSGCPESTPVSAMPINTPTPWSWASAP